MKGKGMTICSIMNRCLVMFLRGQKVSARAVLMKHRRKGKGGQVIILQMDQQLKTKNISDGSGQLFCCKCKDKFLLENALMIKINFNLLKILTMNSLNVKHQGKSSNQLAFHLSAYTHL